MEFEDGRRESTIECELRGEDLQGSYHKTVQMDGLSSEWAAANGVESGVTTFFTNDVVIDETKDILKVPSNAEIEVCNNMYQIIVND